jgi:hypothetical protein
MEGVDAGSGWAVFSLDYHVDMPISLIFTPEAMSTYRTLFNFLWRIQHLHHSLASMWKRHIGYSRRQNQNRQFSLESLRKSSPAPAKEKVDEGAALLLGFPGVVPSIHASPPVCVCALSWTRRRRYGRLLRR